jgi:Domain of Unknown Function (DUF1080)
MRCMASHQRFGKLATCVCIALLTLGCSGKKDVETTDRSNAASSNAIRAQPTDAKSAPKSLAPVDESLDIEALMAARLPADELGLGWIKLFDGQSLFGWENAGSANWHVEDGSIIANEGETGLLVTTSRFADFELKMEFQADATTNSGVFLRTPPKPTAPDKDCYELNIAPSDNPFPTGSLVGRARVEPSELGDFDFSQWHEFHALLDRQHIQIWVDGKSVVDYTDPTGLQAGQIGLQFREGQVAFRNIRVRPLLYEKVLPAKDLSRWNIPESPAKFTTHDAGVLQIDGGKGQIELKQAFGNFALQAKVMTLAPEVNSGIFFRCIPGDEMNGYECQIQNSWIGDRRRPKDSGTGAIFRRQPARAVLSDDSEWAYMTIITTGNHIATWVQGIQVIDWSDTREPHENPRLGRRDEAGSIILQAHDPTCKLKVATLEIGEIPSDVAKPK